MRVFIKGLNSCVMRKKELEHYRRFITAAGHELVADPGGADAILLWSCAFRADMAGNSAAESLRYQREYPAATVMIGGCLPDIDPARIPPDFTGQVFAWREDRGFLEATFGAGGGFDGLEPVFAQPASCRDAAQHRRQNPGASVTFHDQFVKVLVSEGCPFACTYCAEKLALPPIRSVPADAVIASLRPLLAGPAAHDVILLADCLGEYGTDLGSSLPALIAELKGVFGGVRFALNNLHPASFLKHYEPLMVFVERGWIRHVNLPIQSASDAVLARMLRDYRVADLRRIFGGLRDSGRARYDTHIIIGFPGETEGDFQQTLDFLVEHRPDYVLTSRFYCAPGVPAAGHRDQVPHEVQLRREQRAEAALQQAGIICNRENSELAQDRLARINDRTTG